jgi:hypothetical protein
MKKNENNNKDIVKDFDQTIAVSMNELSSESALDLMDRTAQCAMELADIISKYQGPGRLPDVIIIGILEHTIATINHLIFKKAEELDIAGGHK